MSQTRIKLGKNMVDCSPEPDPVVRCTFCGEDTEGEYSKVTNRRTGKIEVLCYECLDGLIADMEDPND